VVELSGISRFLRQGNHRGQHTTFLRWFHFSGGLFGQLNVFAQRDAGHIELRGFDLQRRKPRAAGQSDGDATSG